MESPLAHHILSRSSSSPRVDVSQTSPKETVTLPPQSPVYGSSASLLSSLPQNGRKKGNRNLGWHKSFTIDHKVFEESAKLRRVILPRSTFYKRFNVILLLVTIYNCVSLPFRWAFIGPQGGSPGLKGSLIFLDYLGDILFYINLLCKFWTAYFQEGMVVTDLHKIRQRYMKSGRFAFDLTCLCPADLFALLAGWPYYSYLRAFRFLRLRSISKYFDMWERGFAYSNALRLIKIFLMIGLLINTVSCIYYVVVLREGLGVDDWVLPDEPFLSRLDLRYLMCVYWTVATLTGLSGQTIGNPHTGLEVYFTIAVMIVGFTMVAAFIGMMSTLIANMNAAEALFRHKMDVLSQYMRYRQLPQQLQQRIMSYYDYVWSRQKGLDDRSILNDLPQYLQQEVAIFLNREILSKVPLFAGSSQGFINELVLQLQPRVYSAKEYIVRVNEVGREMFFISKGTVEILGEDGTTIYSSLGEGSYFGEIALLYSDKRTASVRARTYCDVFILSREDLERVLVDYPEMDARIREVARTRLMEGKVPVSPASQRELLKEGTSPKLPAAFLAAKNAALAIARMRLAARQRPSTPLSRIGSAPGNRPSNNSPNLLRTSNLLRSGNYALLKAMMFAEEGTLEELAMEELVEVSSHMNILTQLVEDALSCATNAALPQSPIVVAAASVLRAKARSALLQQQHDKGPSSASVAVAEESARSDCSNDAEDDEDVNTIASAADLTFSPSTPVSIKANGTNQTRRVHLSRVRAERGTGNTVDFVSLPPRSPSAFGSPTADGGDIPVTPTPDRTPMTPRNWSVGGAVSPGNIHLTESLSRSYIRPLPRSPISPYNANAVPILDKSPSRNVCVERGSLAKNAPVSSDIQSPKGDGSQGFPLSHVHAHIAPSPTEPIPSSPSPAPNPPILVPHVDGSDSERT